MQYLTRLLLAVTVASLAVLGLTQPASAGERAKASVRASFEGRTINLAQTWDGAQACAITQAEARCFRSEGEMDQWLGRLGQLDALSQPDASASASAGASASAASSTCPSWLRLYDGTNYGGQVVYLNTQGMWINLGGAGFDNRTSSYKIGACAAAFAEGAGGSGAQYTWNTSPGYWSAYMVPGWNNRVSSVAM